MKNLLNKPYDLLENIKFRYIYVFGGISFALLFLWVFEPFGLYNLGSHLKIITISLHIGCGLFLLITQFFLLQPLIIKKYTVAITIIWIALSFFILGFSGFIINAYLFNSGVFYFGHFFLFQGIILSIGIILISLTVLIHYNYLLRKRLTVSNHINKQIKEKAIEKFENKIIVLESETRKDYLELFLDNLLYITSADNYVDIYYMENQTLNHKLIRNSLTKICNKYSDLPEIFRCHKSYIVNKRKIESISGNTAGYKIKLSNYKEYIPVSRELNSSIKTLTS
ncbi:MAG: LytTR family transcriptional regulator DNA-binding domain-containing protein [Bacteroidetes bacterium]|nr:LytTR family transcriptional regulator DNA-binding domain-containing protein [Bacteroidota bacterium]